MRPSDCLRFFYMLFLLFALLQTEAQSPYINARQNMDSINHELRLEQNSLVQFDLLNRKTGYYMAIGQIDSMEAPTRQMLQLVQDLDKDSISIITYNLIGDYFMMKGNWPASLEYLFKGLRIAEKNGSNGNLCSLCEDIAETYRLSQNYNEALPYAKRALDYLSDKGVQQTTLPSQVYQSFALIYLARNKPDSALHYNQQANEASLRVKDEYQYSQVLMNFALIYEALNDEMLAESYFKKGIAFCHEYQIAYVGNSTKYYYSRFLLTQRNYLLAKTNCLESLSESIRTGNFGNVVERADLCKQIYTKLANKDSIYYYALLKDAYVDSVNRLNMISRIHDVTVNERLHEIEREGQLEDEREERRHNIQYAALALGVITFLSLFFVLSHSVVINEKLVRFFGVLALLLFFELINLYVHPFLARATNDSPPLMLGALVCIAALLIPLHHRLEHWITHQLVEKNKKIRLAAAKRTIATLEREK